MKYTEHLNRQQEVVPGSVSCRTSRRIYGGGKRRESPGVGTLRDLKQVHDGLLRFPPRTAGLLDVGVGVPVLRLFRYRDDVWTAYPARPRAAPSLPAPDLHNLPVEGISASALDALEVHYRLYHRRAAKGTGTEPEQESDVLADPPAPGFVSLAPFGVTSTGGAFLYPREK